MYENVNFDIDEKWFSDNIEDNLNQICIPAKESSHTQSKHPLKPNNDLNHLQNQTNQKIVLKRKFPGPAGLFCETDNTNSKIKCNSNIGNQTTVISSTLLCSQNTAQILEGPTWLMMQQDFSDKYAASLLNQYNIEWINHNSLHNLMNKKVPFLSSIIKRVKNTTKTPIFLLADRTGEIEALISTDLYEEYDQYLHIDSVMVLKEFSLLSVSSSKHYVNITADNLVRIYAANHDREVQVINVQERATKNLTEEIYKFIDKYKDVRNINSSSVSTASYNKNERFTEINVGNFHLNSTNANNLNTKSQINRSCVNIVSDNKQSSMINSSKSQTDEHIDKHLEKKKLKNIFESNNSSIDFDLSMDDFNEEFELPESNVLQASVQAEGSLLKSAKPESDSTSSLSKDKPEMTEPRNLSDSQQNKIDCTQVTIIGQTNENPDIIKEVFADLDVGSLFDDF